MSPRCAELVGLEVDKIQQREGPWVIPDLVGKGNRLRTVTLPGAVKVQIDAWTRAAKISQGKIFRPVKGRASRPRTRKPFGRWSSIYASGTSLGKLVPITCARACLYPQ